MPRTLHVPVRMCIACRNRSIKPELIRIVNDGGVCVIDKDQSKQTRGVYICESRECILKAFKTRAFEKAFKGADTDAIKKLLMEDN